MKFLNLLLLFIFINFKNINSVNVNVDQSTCLNEIGSITGDSNMSNAGLCSIFGMICDVNGFITKLMISSVTQNVTKWENLTCLKLLTALEATNLVIETNFIYNVPSNVTELNLGSSNITSIDKTISPLNTLTLTGLPLDLNIKASYLTNVISFTSNNPVNLEIDDPSNIQIKLQFLSLYTNSLPDLTSLKNLITANIRLGPQFNTSTFVNLLSFANISYISMTSLLPYQIDFPTQFSSMVNPNISYVYFSNFNFNSPLQPIDFSNFKMKDFDLFFLIPGYNFNVNGKVPIILPTNNVNTFMFQGGNVSIPDLSLFSGVKILSLPSSKLSGEFPKYTLSNPRVSVINFQQNSISGTVDPSWCQYKMLANLDLSYNKMNGTLPDCISCYLNKTSVRQKFTNNNFENFLSIKTCNYSKITLRLEQITDGKLYRLFGKNLGFDSFNFVFDGSFRISVNYIDVDNYTVSFLQMIDTTTVKSIVVQLLVPSLNFTLSVSNTPPIIDTIFQNNNTFTINGSFFDYDYSVVTIKIGDTIVCSAIPPTTFYQIICTIGYPIREYGNKMVTVNVGGKISNTKSISLQYTKIPCTIANCNGNGFCDDHIGECQCSKQWVTIGDNVCLIPNHYVSSTSQVSLSEGGTLSLYGFFGNLNENLEITIQYNSSLYSNVLPISIISEEFIQVTINSSIIGGGKKITISQNGLSWSGIIYPYSDPVLLCPNNCGGESSGTCNTATGSCTCKPLFIGFDCQPAPTVTDQSKIPKSITNVNNKLATASISNEQTSFSFLFVSIVELNINSEQVSYYPLANNWTPSDGNNSNIYHFSQIVNNASVALTIEEIVGADKDFTFAGSTFTVSNGGIKISFSISNWNYQSSLNTIQIQMSSDIGTLADAESNKCNNVTNEKAATIESSSNSNSFVNNVNYLKVIKNNKILFGRFQDKLLSDNRATTALTSLISKDENSILIGLNLPHCNECLLDPDFSVLVSPDFITECGKDSSRKWVIPVAVVVSVCGAVFLVTIAVVIVKKHSVKLRIGLRNVSLKSFKDNSKK